VRAAQKAAAKAIKTKLKEGMCTVLVSEDGGIIARPAVVASLRVFYLLAGACSEVGAAASAGVAMRAR
jgi:hypothetical protein